jgi:hypothetical protein
MQAHFMVWASRIHCMNKLAHIRPSRCSSTAEGWCEQPQFAVRLLWRVGIDFVALLQVGNLCSLSRGQPVLSFSLFPQAYVL